MDKFTDHSFRAGLTRFLDYIDMKCIVATVFVELGMFLIAVYKEQGRAFLPILLLLVTFTVAGCIISTCAGADKKLFVIIVVLLSLGFLVQQIQSKGQGQIYDVAAKLGTALATALLVALIYKRISELLTKDVVIIILMLLQTGISLVVLLMGQVIGAGGSQGATISIKGITPFEFVKVIYIFIAAGLLCSEKEGIRIIKWSVNRSIVLAAHTAVLSIIFVLCNELGTLLIVYITGILMMFMFAPEKKWILILEIISIVGFIGVWFICGRVLFPFMTEHEGVFPGIVEKLIRRFGVVFHPELYINDYGYQGTRGLMAIASGGWLGIGTERRRISLPEANNDYIFANVVETCGILIGFILIIFILAFFKRAMDIADRCDDDYSRGTASGIAVVIAVEAVIHIGYNLALLPVTGIPLYFLSQGFSAVITSMCLVAVLLVISIRKESVGGYE